nr:MAG TPA: hypothetical protein [Caudoviricetes sp.]
MPYVEAIKIYLRALAFRITVVYRALTSGVSVQFETRPTNKIPVL